MTMKNRVGTAEILVTSHLDVYTLYSMRSLMTCSMGICKPLVFVLRFYSNLYRFEKMLKITKLFAPIN